MRTLIEVDRYTWSRVKQYATIRDYSLSRAVDFLLSQALSCPKHVETEENEKNEFLHRHTQ